MELLLLFILLIGLSPFNTIAFRKNELRRRAERPKVELSFNKYHNHEELVRFMKKIHARYPKITHIYKIGESSQGRDIMAIIISSYPKSRRLLKPNFKYVANIHGNEAVGRELLLHLIKYLVESYYYDQSIKQLVDDTAIHIVPCINPDGFELAEEGDCSGIRGRTNANKYDLNRNFPDLFAKNEVREQPEAKAIKSWLREYPFVLSAMFHGGALVASYPYDNSPSGNDKMSITPENDVIRHLALTYALNHNKMSEGKPCPRDDFSFKNGITNGAAWYAVKGGYQDYNYVHGQCMDITLEISCCKYPPAKELSNFWALNQKSMLVFIDEVHRGVKGVVVGRDTQQPIAGAEISIEGRDVSFKTTKRGEYWRILRPGNYKINVKANGYQPTSKEFKVDRGRATILDIEMKHESD